MRHYAAREPHVTEAKGGEGFRGDQETLRIAQDMLPN